MEIATTILAQLGGMRFKVMTGSKNFTATKDGLHMHLSKNKAKAKYLTIQLTPDDLYTLTFTKWKNNELVEVNKIEGVYCDQLQETFTDVTGLYTKL